jgi:hypothetical protein
MRAHLRSELYTYLDRPHLEAGGAEPPTLDSLDARIASAKGRLDHDR